MAIDFDYFLNRKYALLGQNADADTVRANAATTSADASATAANAAAKVDITRAGLLPGESAASIALQRAQANLQNQTASTVGPLARANIGLIGANTASTRVNTLGDLNTRVLNPAAQPGESLVPQTLQRVLGPQFRFGSILGQY